MRYEATRSEALFLVEHSLYEQGSVSTPSCFLHRACCSDLFPNDEQDAEDADSKQGKDWKGGGEAFSATGGHSSSQPGKFKGSQQEHARQTPNI